MPETYCLGIETTAHTFGAGIVSSSGKVLANVKDAYRTNDGEGGILPARAADHHVEVCGQVISGALQNAGLRMGQIGTISYSAGPGIGHCLRVGAFVARSLAALHKIPLVPVNHCASHLEIGRLLTPVKDPVMLYVSGANTQVIAAESGRYRIFGETLDIGVGNFLDTFARHMGYGFPGGPKIQELAARGIIIIELPYVIKGMDVSFGGLLTNVKRKFDSAAYSQEDLAYSVQETVFAMLVEASERALAHCRRDELLLGGGVACNTRLQEMAKVMCEARGAKLFVPENQFLVDNGAMIAWMGVLEYRARKGTPVASAGINPYWRTDEVEIPA